MGETAVVTVFLRNGTDVLLLRRSDAVGSYVGHWGAVAGHAEGDPDGAARQEIAEETGLDPDADVTLVRAGEEFVVDDPERGDRWRVSPYLFDCDRRTVLTNWETDRAEWVPPTAILRRRAVPDLWRSYRAVAPTVESVRTDRDHGSTDLSVRALEVLRDRAAERAVDWSPVYPGGDGRPEAPPEDDRSLAELAAALADARSDMAAVRNRVNRVASRVAPDFEPAGVDREAAAVIRAAQHADDRAASEAATLVDGEHVVTLSRSGTVLAALRRGDPSGVTVAVSRPGAEGVATAERLTDAGLDVTLTSDAAAPGQVAQADRVLVGADAVDPGAGAVNKVGTFPLALAADHHDVPVTVVCARDKVVPATGGSDGGQADSDARPATGEQSEVRPASDPLYDGAADLALADPVFETTPLALVDAVVTEAGETPPADLDAVAADLAALADWRN
ncbi:MAG: NUDIX domain-containing protein [Halobacteriaceae archaeon]